MACERIVRIVCCGFVLGLLPAPVGAQNRPVIDLFAGYSLLPADGADFPRHTSHGLQVSVAGHVNHWFALFGEIGAQFDRSTEHASQPAGRAATVTVRQLLLGPRFTGRFGAVEVFGHGLFGVASGDAGPDFAAFSDSGVAFGGGGGIDVRASRLFAVRVQHDLIGSFADMVEGNSRFAVGMVVKAGRR
jgi:hypothetical protein